MSKKKKNNKRHSNSDNFNSDFIESQKAKCQKKIRYESIEEAEARAAEDNEKYKPEPDRRREAYFCPQCLGYHVTSHPREDPFDAAVRIAQDPHWFG